MLTVVITLCCKMPLKGEFKLFLICTYTGSHSGSYNSISFSYSFLFISITDRILLNFEQAPLKLNTDIKEQKIVVRYGLYFLLLVLIPHIVVSPFQTKFDYKLVLSGNSTFVLYSSDGVYCVGVKGWRIPLP